MKQHPEILGISQNENPITVEESVFESFPQLGRVIKIADIAADETIKTKDKKTAIEDMVCNMAEDPDKFLAILDDLAYLSDSEVADGAYRGNAEKLKNELLRALENPHWRKEKFPPSPEILEKWLFIYATHSSEEYRHMAELILQKMVGRCTSRVAIVSFIYNLVYAGATSSNNMITRKMLEILAYQTPIFGPNPEKDFIYRTEKDPHPNKKLPLSEVLSLKETPFIHYMIAIFEPDDDEVLKQHMEIESSIDYLLAQHTPELKEKRYSGVAGQITSSEAFRNKISLFYGMETKKMLIQLRESQQSPPRLQKINDWYMRQGQPERADLAGTVRLQGFINPDVFPYNLVLKNPGPLRQWQNEQIEAALSGKEGGIQLNLSLPGFEATNRFQDFEEALIFIREQLQAAPSSESDVSFSEPRFLKTLSYLVPEMLLGKQKEEYFQRLREANTGMRKEMIEDAKYFLSPRGDILQVKDPVLQGLGFHEIQFKLHPKRRGDMEVEVLVGHYRFQFLIDDTYTFYSLRDRSHLVLSPFAIFFEHVILSHLHAIRCDGDRLTPMIGGKSKKNGIINGGEETTPVARRPHFRTLSTGQKPSSEQIILASKPPYCVNLVAHNIARENLGLGVQTFVREVKGEIPNGPMRFSAPHATDTLKEILATTT